MVTQIPFKIDLSNEEGKSHLLALSEFMHSHIFPKLLPEWNSHKRQEYIKASLLRMDKGNLLFYLCGHPLDVVSKSTICYDYTKVAFPPKFAHFYNTDPEGSTKVAVELVPYGKFLTNLEPITLQSNYHFIGISLNVHTGEALLAVDASTIEVAVNNRGTFVVEVPLDCHDIPLWRGVVRGQDYQVAEFLLNAWCNMRDYLCNPATLRDSSYQFTIYINWVYYILSQPAQRYVEKDVRRFISGQMLKQAETQRILKPWQNLKNRIGYKSLNRLVSTLLQAAEQITLVLEKKGKLTDEWDTNIKNKLIPRTANKFPLVLLQTLSSLYLPNAIEGWDFVCEKPPYLTLVIPRMGMINGYELFPGKFYTDLIRHDLKRPLVKSVLIYQRLEEERSDYAMHIEIDTKYLNLANPDLLKWASTHPAGKLYWQPIGSVPRKQFNQLKEIQRCEDSKRIAQEDEDEDRAAGVYDILGTDYIPTDILHWNQLLEKVGVKPPDLGIDYFDSPRDYVAEDIKEKQEEEDKKLFDSIYPPGYIELKGSEETDVDNSPITEG